MKSGKTTWRKGTWPLSIRGKDEPELLTTQLLEGLPTDEEIWPRLAARYSVQMRYGPRVERGGARLEWPRSLFVGSGSDVAAGRARDECSAHRVVGGGARVVRGGAGDAWSRSRVVGSDADAGGGHVCDERTPSRVVGNGSYFVSGGARDV
jgi:hypothetical protein